MKRTELFFDHSNGHINDLLTVSTGSVSGCKLTEHGRAVSEYLKQHKAELTERLNSGAIVAELDPVRGWFQGFLTCNLLPGEESVSDKMMKVELEKGNLFSSVYVSADKMTEMSEGYNSKLMKSIKDSIVKSGSKPEDSLLMNSDDDDDDDFDGDDDDDDIEDEDEDDTSETGVGI